MIATIVVARILGRENYGEYGMIQSTVDSFSVFAGFGLGLTATKHVAEFRQSDPKRAGRIIGLSRIMAGVTGIIIAGLLLVFSSHLAEKSIHAPHLANALRIGSLVLLISALNGAQTGALAGFEAFKTIAKVNALVGLISFPVLMIGAWFGGVTGLVWALVVNLCFNWLLNHRAIRLESARNGVPFSFKGSMKELPLIWRFALPATLSGLMVGPANWVCRAMLTSQPDGYSEMGILSAALIFQGLLMFISNMLGAPLLSMVSKAGTDISNKLGTINILSSWILGAFLALPLLTFPEAVQYLFGSEYATRSFRVTFSLVVLSTSIVTFKAGLSRILAANSMLWWGFLSNSLWAVILITASFIFIHLGAIGLAGSMAIAYILNTVIMLPLFYSKKLVPAGTLFSPEAIFIWMVIFAFVIMNILDVSLAYRAIFFVPGLGAMIISFIRISKISSLPSDSIITG